MRGWEGLYGRPRGGEVVVFPQDISEMNRYAGDHKGPPIPASSTLAPTNVDGLRLRLMPLGRPRGSPWKNVHHGGDKPRHYNIRGVDYECCVTLVVAKSLTMAGLKAGRSFGLRLVTQLRSLTTSWSTQLAPALRMSSWMV